MGDLIQQFGKQVRKYVDRGDRLGLIVAATVGSRRGDGHIGQRYIKEMRVVRNDLICSLIPLDTLKDQEGGLTRQATRRSAELA